jgi:multisubunit Na+/H+ antiporter MnhB subunit
MGFSFLLVFKLALAVILAYLAFARLRDWRRGKSNLDLLFASGCGIGAVAAAWFAIFPEAR